MTPSRGDVARPSELEISASADHSGKLGLIVAIMRFGMAYANCIIMLSRRQTIFSGGVRMDFIDFHLRPIRTIARTFEIAV